MGNISPGEPLHMIEAGVDWIDEWFCVQEYSDTISDALIWRKERDATDRNPQETYIRAEKFVDDILDKFF